MSDDGAVPEGRLSQLRRVPRWSPVVQEKGKIEGFVDFLDSFKVSEYTGNIEVR